MSSRKTTSPKKISTRRKSLPKVKAATPLPTPAAPLPKERRFIKTNEVIPAKYDGVLSKYTPELDPEKILSMFPKEPLVVDRKELPIMPAYIADSIAANLDKEALFFKSKIDAFDKIAKKALKEKLLHEKEILTGKKELVKNPKTKTTMRKIKDWISNKLFDFIYYLNK
jgi:hypothetical protein